MKKIKCVVLPALAVVLCLTNRVEATTGKATIARLSLQVPEE